MSDSSEARPLTPEEREELVKTATLVLGAPRVYTPQYVEDQRSISRYEATVAKLQDEVELLQSANIAYAEKNTALREQAELEHRWGAKVSVKLAEAEAELSRLRSEGVTDAMRDTQRLDWLDGCSWITLDKTDESDNNGVGLVDSAVRLESTNPDGDAFPPVIAATFREAIDAAMSRSSQGSEDSLR